MNATNRKLTTQLASLADTVHDDLAHAAAHRAMAKSALFSDSSAAVRLKRYNAHIEKARALEAKQDDIQRRNAMRAFDILRSEKAEVANHDS